MPGYDLFCAGHVFLGGGRLFVVGGHIQNNVGLPYATTYDPFNNLWTGVPDMHAGRWYPTATLLSTGDVLVASGSINDTLGENTLPSVFQVQSSTWRHLTGAELFLDLYPRMHLMADGRVFNSAPSTVSRALDTSGTGAWSVIATHALDVYRDYGSSVMYSSGRILVAGGSDPPTETAEVIDLTQPNPIWRQVPSMQFPRRHLNAAVLPDGKVLVTGGTSGPGFSNVEDAGIRRRDVEPRHRNMDDDGERPDSAPVSLQHRPASRRKTAQYGRQRHDAGGDLRAAVPVCWRQAHDHRRLRAVRAMDSRSSCKRRMRAASLKSRCSAWRRTPIRPT